MSPDRLLSGMTGVTGKDGLLTPDLQTILNSIQIEATRRCFDYLDNMSPGDLYPEVAMATGIGKGNIIHRVVEEQIRRNPESRILLIAGTKIILVEQTHTALARYQKEVLPDSIFISIEENEELIDESISYDDDLERQHSILYSTGSLFQGDVNVHVATIQTLQSETKKGSLRPDEYDLLIIDEVHNIGTPTRKSIVDKFSKVIGFTATPYRYSGEFRTPEEYGFEIIYSLSLPEAQNLYLLPPLVGMQIDTKDLVDEIPTNNKGQIDYKKLERVLKNSPELLPYIADRVANIIIQDELKYKTVIAVNFVWEAQELANLLYEKGIKVGLAVNRNAARQVHTTEVPAIGSIERYSLPNSHANSIQVLISPYVASEGFDKPFTEILVWASPTDSPLRYTQYTGRLARRAAGKAFGVVVDCLYQTNKYRWSYNMGMWMKGSVVQLDNGLLWLGPQTDIASIKNLPFMGVLRERTDKRNILDRRNNELLELQEDDFPLIQREFGIFKVNSRNQALFDQTIEALRKTQPSSFVMRSIAEGRQIIEVFIDRKVFTQEILAAGFKFKEKDLPEIDDSDFPLTVDGFNTYFVTKSGKDWLPMVHRAYEEIKHLDPTLFTLKKNHNSTIEVCIEKEWFIDELIKRGFELKRIDLIDIQDSDFPVTLSSIRRRFVGIGTNEFHVAREAVSKLREKRSDLFVYRRISSGKIVEVCIDTQFLLEEFVNLGFRLRDSNIEDIKDTDIQLTRKGYSVFKAGTSNIIARFEPYLAELRILYPDLFVMRTVRKRVQVEVFTDRQLFIDEMLKRGFKLKDK